MMPLEIVPDGLNVVQFRRILGQPLDRKPMRTSGKRCQGELAGVDWTIVPDQHHPLGGLAGLGTIKPIQLLEMGDEVAAALVGLVCTMSWRVTWSSEPIIATFLAWPGAGTRKSAPALAHTRAR
jgi:hypothetical protein